MTSASSVPPSGGAADGRGALRDLLLPLLLPPATGEDEGDRRMSHAPRYSRRFLRAIRRAGRDAPEDSKLRREQKHLTERRGGPTGSEENLHSFGASGRERIGVFKKGRQTLRGGAELN